jgi:outer membrane protein assembly factor BamB
MTRATSIHRSLLYLAAPILLMAIGADALEKQVTDWPAFRGNQLRSGFYNGPSGYPSGDPLWTRKLEGPIISSPSVANGIVYTGCRDSTIHAISAATGSVLWKKKTAGWVDASPLIADGKVIVGSRDENIYILDAQTGNEISLLPAGVQLSSAGLAESGLLLTGLGPPLNGFSMMDPAGVRDPWTVYFTQMSYSSPALLGSWAVIGADDGRLYGMNMATKKVAWAVQTGGGVYLSTPAIIDSVVYFAPGDYDKNVYAIDLVTGKNFWKSSGTGSLAKSTDHSTLAADPQLILELRRMKPTHRARFASYLAKRGVSWAQPLSVTLKKSASSGFLQSGNEIRTSSVALDSSKVYVIRKETGYSNDNEMTPLSRFTLLALDAFNGALAWRFSEITAAVPLGYCSSPIIARDKVFFGWGDGHIFMLDAKTGVRRWADTLAGDIISSPAIANGNLYVATMEGNLYCYKLTGTPPGLDFQRSTYCYPNPARKGVSHIQVYVARDATLDMTIFSIAERPVMHINERLKGDSADHDGKFVYDWDLKNVANGIYFTRIVVKYNDGGTDKKVLKIAVLK